MFTKKVLDEMVAGLDAQSKTILVKNPAFISTLRGISSITRSADDLIPKPSLIFEFARRCPISSVKIVLMGTEPTPCTATGMAFSGNGRPHPSIKNIYKTMISQRLINEMPQHGDLSSWAAQGVLMLNINLTHGYDWSAYTSELVSSLGDVIFILLGRSAQDMSQYAHGPVLQWGHPAPITPANKQPGKYNFINCDCFKRANELLAERGQGPINWNSVCENVPAKSITSSIVSSANLISAPIADTITCAPIIDNYNGPMRPGALGSGSLYIFTDGASRANGKPDCRASWGYYICDLIQCECSAGLVTPITIVGKQYKSSNNRGELSAVLYALERVLCAWSHYHNIVVVTDSEYSINCITEWFPGWEKKGDLNTKMNVDIIAAIIRVEAALNTAGCAVTYKHVRGHQTEPPAKDIINWFMWYGNDRVDKLCTDALK
jgi:uracil-DNA glycosylase